MARSEREEEKVKERTGREEERGRAGGERGMTVHEAARILGQRGGEAKGGEKPPQTAQVREAAKIMGKKGGEARGKERKTT